MTKATFSACFAAFFSFGLAVAPAQAQLARTFVSSLGNDANDCQRLTPCRTFQGAHDKTLANGEITVLDPGGYGAVTITKAISIINDGVGEAGALVSGGLNGITINAAANDAVSLRGLTIKGDRLRRREGNPLHQRQIPDGRELRDPQPHRRRFLPTGSNSIRPVQAASRWRTRSLPITKPRASP